MRITVCKLRFLRAFAVVTLRSLIYARDVFIRSRTVGAHRISAPYDCTDYRLLELALVGVATDWAIGGLFEF